MLDQIEGSRSDQQSFFSARRKIGEAAVDVAKAHKIKLQVMDPEDSEDEKWTFYTGVSTSTKSSSSSMQGVCGDRHLSKIHKPKEGTFDHMVSKNFTNFSNLSPA
jgi:hypothetical protein